MGGTRTFLQRSKCTCTATGSQTGMIRPRVNATGFRVRPLRYMRVCVLRVCVYMYISMFVKSPVKPSRASSVQLYWQRCEHCSSKARAAVVDQVAFSSGNCTLLVGVIDVDGVGDVCSRRGVEGPLTGAGIWRPGGRRTERAHCRFQDCVIARHGEMHLVVKTRK
jgi:hypothetical protein